MSQLEDALVFQLRVAKLPVPVREHLVIPGRRWRFDLAWPERLIACELDGGTWIRGAHSRGHGQRRDCQKQNAAMLQGWTLFRFTTDMVKSGEALDTLTQALDP